MRLMFGMVAGVGYDGRGRPDSVSGLSRFFGRAPGMGARHAVERVKMRPTLSGCLGVVVALGGFLFWLVVVTAVVRVIT